jgi:hypothetical protein
MSSNLPPLTSFLVYALHPGSVNPEIYAGDVDSAALAIAAWFHSRGEHHGAAIIVNGLVKTRQGSLMAFHCDEFRLSLNSGQTVHDQLARQSFVLDLSPFDRSMIQRDVYEVNRLAARDVLMAYEAEAARRRIFEKIRTYARRVAVDSSNG